MTLKQEHYIFGLLGIGAILVIIYLMRENNGAVQTTAPAIEGPVPLPQYPNSQPIKSGDIIVEGYAPDSLPNVAVNGIQIPQVELEPSLDGGCGGCGGGDNFCDDAGLVVSKMKVPQSVLDAAIANLASFKQKRISFTQGY